jgi:hypothetical protein
VIYCGVGLKEDVGVGRVIDEREEIGEDLKLEAVEKSAGLSLKVGSDWSRSESELESEGWLSEPGPGMMNEESRSNPPGK